MLFSSLFSWYLSLSLPPEGQKPSNREITKGEGEVWSAIGISSQGVNKKCRRQIKSMNARDQISTLCSQGIHSSIHLTINMMHSAAPITMNF
ncbi:hypothetical protein PRUPE_6G363700 [Prunus persica]|uniref:Uncharacterized protein n=1 Tax=Prunus persica TaxID=3760 RepID=A0A251P2I0_PRUPE|nr:hypothetical protein PRUPE_6G363700 [Prunus persica]